MQMQDIQSLEIVKTPRLIFQKWLLITISVALLILLIITVGYISSQRNNQNSNTQIQPTNTIITEPSNTYIYTNNILKYELTLPNGYIVMEDSLVPSDLPQANDVNEMANYRNVRILKKDAQSTDDYAFIIFDYDATDNNDFFNYMKESQIGEGPYYNCFEISTNVKIGNSYSIYEGDGLFPCDEPKYIFAKYGIWSNSLNTGIIVYVAYKDIDKTDAQEIDTILQSINFKAL